MLLMLSLPEDGSVSVGLVWHLVQSQGPQLCLEVYQLFTFHFVGKDWSFAVFSVQLFSGFGIALLELLALLKTLIFVAMDFFFCLFRALEIFSKGVTR